MCSVSICFRARLRKTRLRADNYLTLSLFMFRIDANTIQPPFPAHQSALTAYFFDRCSYFHAKLSKSEPVWRSDWVTISAPST